MLFGISRLNAAHDRHCPFWRTGIWYFLLAISIGSLAPATSAAQQVWLGMRGLAENWKGVHGHEDWERLFLGPNPTWPASLSRVGVLQIGTQIFERISDSDLRKTVARLHELNIALAVEMLAQSYEGSCGRGVEGYANPSETAAVAVKIKQAGGELQYAAMDAPLWFGHYYRGKSACLSSIPDVVKRVAANIAEYRKAYPRISVGDVEPIPSLTSQPRWQIAYQSWMASYSSTTGQPLAFLHFDIDWGNPGWQAGLKAAVQFARLAHLPFGVIYNASPGAKSDADWLNQASRHMSEVEKTLGIIPNHAIFQSWIRFPTHAISDAAGPGMDYLLEQYNKWLSQRGH